MSIFVEGIYGHSVQLDILDISSQTLFEAGQAASVVDGPLRPLTACLFVPSAFDHGATRQQNLAICQALLLRQIEYLSGGTQSFSEGISALRAWSSKSEVLRPHQLAATKLEKRFALSHPANYLDALFAKLEARRIDESLARKYPGCIPGLQLLQVLADQGPQADSKQTLELTFELSADLAVSLQSQILALLDDFSSGLKPLESLNSLDSLKPPKGFKPPEDIERRTVQSTHFSWSGRSSEILALANQVTLPSASVADSAQAALNILALTLDWLKLLEKQVSPEPLAVTSLQPELQQVAPTLPSLTSMASANDGISDDPINLEQPGSSSEDYATEAATVLEENAQNLGERTVAVDIQQKKKNLISARSFLYDEWNYEQSRYLSAWCRVIEQSLNGEDSDFIVAVRRRHPQLWEHIKRSFAAMKPASFKRVYRAAEGDDLDLDRLVQRHAERNIVRQQDEGLFVRRERTVRDVSVAFLVDMSASTSILIPKPAEVEPLDAAPADTLSDYPYLYGGGMSAIDKERSSDSGLIQERPRRVIDVAQDAVALMCEALHHLGDDFAVFGFSGDGREKVDFYLAKEFHEPLSGRTWAAISAMQPKQSSRVGPAIRHSSRKILKHATGRRLMIVISDGYPQDRDYGPSREEVEYGIQDTARALREAEQQGIQTFFVTVDPAGYDYLGRMCPENRYLLIEDVAELPRALSTIYQSMKLAPSTRPRRREQTLPGNSFIG